MKEKEFKQTFRGDLIFGVPRKRYDELLKKETKLELLEAALLDVYDYNGIANVRKMFCIEEKKGKEE